MGQNMSMPPQFSYNMQQQQWGQQTHQMWWGGAEYRCNKNNMHVFNYNTNTLNSTLNYHLGKCQPNSRGTPAISQQSPEDMDSRHLPFYPPSNLRDKTSSNGLFYTPAPPYITSAPVCKKIKTINLVTVTMSNGTQIASIHKCKLDILPLSEAAQFGHILPSRTQHSLFSVVKLFNAGCEVQFWNISCKVRHRSRVILSGTKWQSSGLWCVSLTGTIQTNPKDVQNTSPPSYLPK